MMMSLRQKKNKTRTHTHTHTTIQKRIHHSKRSPGRSWVQKKKKNNNNKKHTHNNNNTRTHTNAQQHINAYTVSNVSMMRSLRKKRTQTHTRIHT